jgi:hypothetical protein
MPQQRRLFEFEFIHRQRFTNVSFAISLQGSSPPLTVTSGIILGNDRSSALLAINVLKLQMDFEGINAQFTELNHMFVTTVRSDALRGAIYSTTCRDST